jgi:hypothetical protein
VAVDLFGVTEQAARDRLLVAVRAERAKPATRPGFPAGPVPFGGAGRPGVRAGRRDELSFPGMLPPVWKAPGRNRTFTGRSELLVRMRALFIESGPGAVAVMHGLGGVGKTQLAVEYAHRFAGDYDVVWWVEAEQTALIAEQVAGLAEYLGLTADGAVVDAAAAVLNALAHRDRWLLVLDNAEEPPVMRRARELVRDGVSRRHAGAVAGCCGPGAGRARGPG